MRPAFYRGCAGRRGRRLRGRVESAAMKQTTASTPPAGGGHVPYVPDSSDQREFTMRALILGLVMCVVLGAANAYLGLRAGMTIAATYPAAVIGMAVLRLFKGSTILEENFARTVGSIGESVAAGAIFTIPAFVILKLWKFDAANMWHEYLVSSALMILGGLLGIMFVTILRRVMVEDPSLPFPESVAASEIHKAGQKGAEAALQLFRAMGVGALIRIVSSAGFGLFRDQNEFSLHVGRLRESFVRLGLRDDSPKVTAGGDHDVLGAGRDAGLPGRRLHHRARARRAELRRRPPGVGPVRAAARLLPRAGAHRPASWRPTAATRRRPGRPWWSSLWKFIVRPIAVGGMLVGAMLHAVQMRQEPDRGHQARRRRRAEVGHRGGRHQADRAGPVAQGGRRGHPGRLRPDGDALLLLHGRHRARRSSRRS